MVQNLLTDTEQAAIEYLREHSLEFLTPQYDTDYNLLRWAQGYSFNLDEALYHLIRHLKCRKLYDLDNINNIKEDRILKQYFPLGVVGQTGKNDQLLVVEYAGRIDLQGILNAVQLSTFVYQRLKFQEAMLKEINKMEAISRKQCAGVYVLDLEGLKLDPKLLSIATGPYRILWTLVYTNYPEWLKTMIIANAPSFVAFVWKAVSALLPERTKTKVFLFSSKDDVKAELQKFCDMRFVPKRYGGMLESEEGDAMYSDHLTLPTDPIPKHLYWVPDTDAPSYSELDSILIAPRQNAIITCRLFEESVGAYFILNRYAERPYSLALYYSANIDGVDVEIQNMHDWGPEFDFPGMPTVDFFKVKTIGSGIYKIKFANSSAWFRSLRIYYRIRFIDENDAPVRFDLLNN